MSPTLVAAAQFDLLPEVADDHRDHERRGVKLIEAMCERLRIPNQHRDLAVHVSRFHTHVHRAMELRPETFLKVLESIDAFRRPERFEEFLLACEADSRGRTGLETQDYPQADFLRGALQAAAAVDGADVATQSHGKDVGEAIRRARIAAVRRYSKT